MRRSWVLHAGVAALVGAAVGVAQPPGPPPGGPPGKRGDRARPGPARGALGVKIQSSADGRAEIAEVLPDSAAAKAKLEAGDVIDKVGGNETHDLKSAVDALRGFK